MIKSGLLAECWMGGPSPPQGGHPESPPAPAPRVLFVTSFWGAGRVLSETDCQVLLVRCSPQTVHYGTVNFQGPLDWGDWQPFCELGLWVLTAFPCLGWKGDLVLGCLTLMDTPTSQMFPFLSRQRAADHSLSLS